jgi:superkiller protein 3
MSSSKEWIEKADLLFDEGKYVQAIELYKKVLNIETNNKDVMIKIGLSYRHLEDYDTAIEFYNNALQIEPDNKTALNNIGYALECKSKIDEAIEYYKKSLTLDPTYDMPLVNLTNIYQERKDYKSAIEVFKNALKEDPLNTANWIDLGRAYRHEENYEEAMAAYGEAIKLDPYNKIAHNNIGYVYYCLNNFEKAIESYVKSLEIDWLYDLPFTNLIKIYKQMIEKKNNDLSLWKKLGNAFYIAKAYKRTLDVCNRAMDLKPDDDELIQLHKRVLNVKQKYDLEPLLKEKIEDALKLFYSISSTVLLSDIIDYIKHKNPEIIFNDEDIKFKIFEVIKEKDISAKLVVNKLVFYLKPTDHTRADYLK